MPGVTGSKEDFVIMVPLLAGAGFHVQSYDTAGQYQPADAGPECLDPPRARYDHELLVGDLLALLESALVPVHAGTIAQLVPARRPKLVASLALLSTPPRPGQGFRPMNRLGPLSTITTSRKGATLMIWGIRRNLLHALPGRVDFVRQRFGWTRRESVDNIIALMKRAPDLVRELAASPVPNLVAVGAHDLWPLGLHREFARGIGAEIAVYSAGHNPCETSPHQLVGDLLRLYAAAPSRS